ncbi:MAG: flagellar hook-basal body complex protein FliE [Desulfobaccales bacterium]
MQVNPSFNQEIIASSLSSSSSPPSASQGQNLFSKMLTEVNGQQRQADAQVKGSLLGDTDIHEAMLGLEKANLSLRLLVQVRNKLVQAYEELSRMSM